MKAPLSLPEPRYLPALDGIRGLAVLMVMFFHFEPDWSPLAALGAPILPHIFAVLCHGGQTGVELFFVLSGYLITRILLAEKGASNYLQAFYLRRILRIFPLYYAALIVGACFFPWRSLWSFWFFLQGFPITFAPGSTPNIFIHFWTLAVEEHFYLLWPLVVFWVSRRHLPWILATVCAGSLAFRLFLEARGINGFYFTPCRLDSISLGALLAVSEGSSFYTRLARHSFLLLVLYALLLLPFLYLVDNRHDLWLRVDKSPAVSLLFVLIILSCSRSEGSLAGFFSLSAWRLLGRYSYAMYVFHPFVFAGLRPFVSHALAGLPLAFGLVLLAAFLSWHLYEKQFLRLKKYFAYQSTV